MPLKTGWYRGYIFVPVMFMTGVFIAFKEPRPKVAGEFKDIGADGAKARSTLLSKEVVMKQSFETSKLYYGFPIFILGYQDQTYGYNVTNKSSLLQLKYETFIRNIHSELLIMFNLVCCISLATYPEDKPIS